MDSCILNDLTYPNEYSATIHMSKTYIIDNAIALYWFAHRLFLLLCLNAI